MTIRVIPRLEIKGPNLVKGMHLEGLRVIGSPQEFAEAYSLQGADELMYMDIVASLYERNSILDLVRTTSERIFIPLTVGGGLRSLDDIRQALRAGADKVSLNTAAIRNPELIREAAQMFGSSTIVISIEAKRRPDGSYEAYTDCGRERTQVEVMSWAKQVSELGAGEILITSIDREGTGEGYDIELTRNVAQAVSIPVIACGGPGKLNDISDVITEGLADAVAISSIIHYDLTEQLPEVAKNASRRISSGKTRTGKASLPMIKKHLDECDIGCRMSGSEVANA